MKWKNVNKKWIVGISIMLVTALVIHFSANGSEDYDLPNKVDFNYDIQPILSQNCYVCHGPDTSTRKANLRLDIRETAIATFKNGGAAIVPRHPNKSILIDRVSSTDPDLRMPPPEAKKILSGREIALLEKWIKQGAEWKPYWAFIQPQKPDLLPALLEGTPSDVIDHLIDEKIKSKQLKPSPSANKNALIRRVSYLLTGLPPAPAAIQTFVSDDSADAYEKMVDQYLNSPHFGERWARHWMDLVRYGEYMGHEFDFPISGAFQYRDYLIRAFNQDVPYDLFVKEHLAGDMLANPRYHPDEGFNESIIGTAYFFLGEGKHSPVSLKGEELDKIDNVIDVTSKTFQALTVSCARCHDHKFDPIPTTDYYAMYGMIESARIGPLPARKTLEKEVQIKRLKEIKRELRAVIGQQLSLVLDQPSAKVIKNQKRFIQSLQPVLSSEKSDLLRKGDSLNYQVIGDFRQGHWNGWYEDGWAFGEAPIMGKPVFNRESHQLTQLSSGVASSQFLSPGVQGTLRSPYFIIEHDSIAVRAAGNRSSIRIIVDNFQLIGNPLWGSFEKVIDTTALQTYIFDVSMVKGHKAYMVFLPGNYTKHAYNIQPSNYIEVEYAIAFNNSFPEMDLPKNSGTEELSLEAKKQAINDWVNNNVNTEKISFLNSLLKRVNRNNYKNAVSPLIKEYDSIAIHLYDSTHFIGVVEGDAVFSPVFIRGNKDQLSAEKVSRRFLHAVNVGPDSFPQQGSGRLAWAESVVDPNNPLTSRVIVNRIWHYIFGRGIVETVDNFGLQGKLPSHPKLLDYLSLHFIEEGWSMKQLIKEILLSQSFRRSTEALAENETIDPDNYFLHHFPVRRLEAEAIRDGMLAVSGSLDKTMYGESVPIYLTEFMTGRGRPLESGPLDGAGRRSIYTVVRRNFLSPMMLVFDTPMPFSTFGKRNTTNVPAQSLTLMNDPFVHDQAAKWAERLLAKSNDSTKEKIQDIYLHAFSRAASPEEIQNAELLLESLAKNYNGTLEEKKNDPQLWADYCHTIFNLKEFIHLM